MEKKIPQHVAIIMDGNGRWAKKRMMPRVAGHRKGAQVIRDIAKVASDTGVKILTLYAFSRENWGRPQNEVDYLMNLPKSFFEEFLPQAIDYNIQIQVIGDIQGLPEKTHAVIDEAIQRTQDCTGMILNFALNYGSRYEITQAVKAIGEELLNQEVSLDQITEDTVSQHLETYRFKQLQDPDLIIRTSGELRLSNFLLWEAAYAEFYFTDTYWPDFNEESFQRAMQSYQQRQRRYGKLKDESQA